MTHPILSVLLSAPFAWVKGVPTQWDGRQDRAGIGCVGLPPRCRSPLVWVSFGDQVAGRRPVTAHQIGEQTNPVVYQLGFEGCTTGR